MPKITFVQRCLKLFLKGEKSLGCYVHFGVIKLYTQFTYYSKPEEIKET